MKMKLVVLSVILLSLSAVGQDDQDSWNAACTALLQQDVKDGKEVRSEIWFDKMPSGLGVDVKSSYPEHEFNELKRKSLSFALMVDKIENLKTGCIRITPVTSALNCHASVSDVDGCYSPMTRTIFIQPEIIPAWKDSALLEHLDNTLIHELRHAFQHAKLGDKADEYCDLSFDYYKRRCERDAEAFAVKVMLEAYGNKQLESILRLQQNSDQIKIIEVYFKATSDALTLPFLDPANEPQ
jgi:hypothetical protein